MGYYKGPVCLSHSHSQSGKGRHIVHAHEPSRLPLISGCRGVAIACPKFSKASTLFRHPDSYLPHDVLVLSATVRLVRTWASAPALHQHCCSSSSPFAAPPLLQPPGQLAAQVPGMYGAASCQQALQPLQPYVVIPGMTGLQQQLMGAVSASQQQQQQQLVGMVPMSMQPPLMPSASSGLHPPYMQPTAGQQQQQQGPLLQAVGGRSNSSGYAYSPGSYHTGPGTGADAASINGLVYAPVASAVPMSYLGSYATPSYFTGGVGVAGVYSYAQPRPTLLQPNTYMTC